MKRKPTFFSGDIALLFHPKRSSKMGNKRIEIDGHNFHSLSESRRYGELKMLERAGKIRNIKLQVPFVLQEGFTLDGKKVQAITYLADFTYEESFQVVWRPGDPNLRWRLVIEDHKGHRTEHYRLKKKMLQFLIHTGKVAGKFIETEAGNGR